MKTTGERPHVVILGGGFGGLAAARRLRRAPVRLTIVDRNNHHLFQPLLYQVATAALSAPDIAAPLRKLVRRNPHARVILGEVSGVDVDARRVLLADGSSLDYDHLVVATGMTHSYFGHDEWAEHAPGLKTLHDALEVRSRVLRAYEAAERERDPERRRALLTFVVIGGGPTGVEMAGALIEIAQRTLARDFRRFHPERDARVVLVEGADRLLPAMHPDSSRVAFRDLEEMGVEVRLSQLVRRVDADGVEVGEDRERIHAGTVIWAAGLRATHVAGELGGAVDRAGRVKVAPDLSVPGRPEVFVVGDLAYLEQDGAPIPGVAQTAIQGGRFAGEQIDRDARGLPRERRFRYRDKGTMATIGRARAVAEVGSARFAGFAAWLLWLVVHLIFLVDFRNRVAVLVEWAYAYLTWRRSARVIVDTAEEPPPALPMRRAATALLVLAAGAGALGLASCDARGTPGAGATEPGPAAAPSTPAPRPQAAAAGSVAPSSGTAGPPTEKPAVPAAAMDGREGAGAEGAAGEAPPVAPAEAPPPARAGTGSRPPRPPGAGPSADPGPDVDACDVLPGRRYRSVRRLEVGRGPDGPVLGNWELGFAPGRFSWRRSDFVELGRLTCDGRTLRGATDDAQHRGEWHPASDRVSWEGEDYRRAP